MFFEKLGLPEQPEGTDWVELLYKKELDACQQARKPDDSPSCASSAYPSTFMAGLRRSDKAKLAVGWILRTLESAGMTGLYWRDTSRCGVRNSFHKPVFTGFVAPAEVLSCMVSHGVVPWTLIS